MPEYIRSDNGPEFVAKDLRKWPTDTGAKTLYIELGSPWETGFCESFNSELRDEFLNGEIFYSLKEVQVLAERWGLHFNTIRPLSSLGYHSPAPEAWVPDNNLTGGRAPSGSYPGTPKAALHCRIQLVQKIGHATGQALHVVASHTGAWIGNHNPHPRSMTYECRSLHGSIGLKDMDSRRHV